MDAAEGMVELQMQTIQVPVTESKDHKEATEMLVDALLNSVTPESGTGDNRESVAARLPEVGFDRVGGLYCFLI